MVEGYCVKCRAKREIKDAKNITMKNGKPAVQGLCPECGTKIFKIGAAK
jgi:DNA-directed RNA polymerase subunit RPC12/RpoP